MHFVEIKLSTVYFSVLNDIYFRWVVLYLCLFIHCIKTRFQQRFIIINYFF